MPRAASDDRIRRAQPKSSRESPKPPSPEGSRPHPLWQAGNAAVDRLLRGDAGLDAGLATPADVERAAAQPAVGNLAKDTGTAPPALHIQQRRQTGSTRDEAQAAVEAFLRRAQQAQGGSTLRVTPEVREAISSLVFGDSQRRTTIDTWLNSAAVPGDPAEFAREVATRLPDTIETSRIDHLNQLSGRPLSLSPVKRLQDLAKSSEVTQPARAPGTGATASELAERSKDIAASLGKPPTNEVGLSVDILRAARIAGGLSEAIRGSGPSPPPSAQARAHPEVDQAIGQIAPDELVPAEVRGTPAAKSFADAREVRVIWHADWTWRNRKANRRSSCSWETTTMASRTARQ